MNILESYLDYLNELTPVQTGLIYAGSAVAGGMIGNKIGKSMRRKILRKKCLQLYQGNPEELKNCMERANILKTASGKTYGFK